jgi:penicillin-binding protein 2
LRKCRSSFDGKDGRHARIGLFLTSRHLAQLILFAVLAQFAPAAFAAQDTTAPLLDNTGFVENPKPTWETQKKARTFVLGIPAPRGQITDRNGKPLAQTRLSYNLSISFPAPLDWPDSKVLAFATQQVTLASGLLKKSISVSDEAILNHYKNRGVLPMDIAEDLSPQELSVVQRGLSPNLVLRQTYVRFYPNGPLAGHIIGYTGREAPLSTRPVENNDLIFSESQGREGLEQVFDNELRGQVGQLHVTFDASGNKMSERIARPPVPGYNVITTLDEDIQRICEKVLAKNCKRGALVVIDPNSGEVLAMASQPGFNPNEFVPVIKKEVFDRYSNDEADPLVPRAYRSAYPAGSTFKVFVGFAALEAGKITPQNHFDCPAAMSIGDHTFKNWKKNAAGSLNFVEALTQSCNTWFYQVAIKIGADLIIEYAHRLGLGKRTGIPIYAESAGNIPTNEYMLRVHKRVIKKGDVANMAIGQGDILITPLQMAQALGVIAAAGKFHQTRLVKQVQSLDNKVVAAYPDRLREEIPVSPEVDKALRSALQNVVYHGQGTGHSAQVKGVRVAGKTGTAQWGPESKQRTAAWFTGFVPAENPEYAFAALYEGDPNDDSVHGGSEAAPLIRKAFREIYKLKKTRDAPPEEDADEKEEQIEAPKDESN